MENTRFYRIFVGHVFRFGEKKFIKIKRIPVKRGKMDTFVNAICTNGEQASFINAAAFVKDLGRLEHNVS